MLKRPPRSRNLSILIGFIVIIALYLFLDAAWTMRSNARSHGKREAYIYIKKSIQIGEQLDAANTVKKAAFSNDVPKGAIKYSDQILGLFVKTDIPKDIYLTKNMVSKSLEDFVTSDKRIIFIPTETNISFSLSKKADLLSVATSDFDSEIIAESAIILDNKTNSDNKEGTQGYFVMVDEEEAIAIARAISYGDIYFSLIPKSVT